MKVLVTGAGGFVGTHLVSALTSAHHIVRTIDRVPHAHIAGVEALAADLTSATDLKDAFEGVDVLVHLAASLKGERDEIMQNTVEGTRRLLSAMSRSATRRLILASSFAVYKRGKVGDVITEDSPIHDSISISRHDNYAKAKLEQECLTREMARQQRWALTILRPGVIWGAGQLADFLLGKRLGPFQLVVAPSSHARLAYVENVADAFVRAVEAQSKPGEQIFNVLDDPVTTVWRFATTIQARRGGLLVPLSYRLGLLPAKLVSGALGHRSRLPYYLQPTRFEAMHQPVSWSNRRLRDSLGWRPRYSFEQALMQTTKSSKENR